jgi:hypothetical protein
MYDTLPALIERALAGNQRPLEYYLREQSRLPGPRANLELADDMQGLLVKAVSRSPEQVRSLLYYLINSDRQHVTSNTPEEFVMLCGIIAFGACAAVMPAWREETYALLSQHACSTYWRVREGVALAYQHLLYTCAQETLEHFMQLATTGNYLHQRAAIVAIAEPAILYLPEMLPAALTLQRIALERFQAVALTERKNESFRILRRTLGYTLSVITAAAPEQGFALMRECATWNDPDIREVLRENLKKKRLAKYAKDAEEVAKLL